jgi:hypothetical protein
MSDEVVGDLEQAGGLGGELGGGGALALAGGDGDEYGDEDEDEALQAI